MNKLVSAILLHLLVVSLVAPSISTADTLLEFVIKKSPAAKATPQTVAVKDGRIMVKAAGGDRNLDLFYSLAEDRVLVVDHQKRTLTTIDEAQVERLNQQTQGVQPLLQGLGEQIAKLSPQDRRKWQELLGDTVSLDRIAKGTEPSEPTRLEPIGSGKVAGIGCRTMLVVQGKTSMAELSLAEPAALKIPDQDYAAIRGLLGLYERLAVKSQRLAENLGLAVPTIAMREMTGIPIALRDLSREDRGSITLRRIKTTPIPAGSMSIPGGYAAKPLTLW